jgi:superfamily II DNA helicase RecQ
MALQCKFFIIPVGDIEEAEVEINRFLRSVRVVNMQRDFVDQGPNSFWSVAVEYLSAAKSAGEKNRLKRSKIDYKQVLSPEDFALFAQLREWRKGEAAEIGVPVYPIFTNEQLAKIAEQKIRTKAGLQGIEGVGEAKVKKYGEAVIEIVSKGSQTPKQTSAEDNETGE